jgi:hypothetical protein
VACCSAACVAFCIVIGCDEAAEAGGALGTPGSDGACGGGTEAGETVTEGVLDGEGCGCAGCAGGAVCASALPAMSNAKANKPRMPRTPSVDRSRLNIPRAVIAIPG